MRWSTAVEELQMMSIASMTTTWCILAVALMPLVCAGVAKGGMFTKPASEGGYDNHQPREWLANQTGYRKRANAAQGNCFEALPFFIGAVLLAQQMGAPQSRVDALAIAFVLLRAAFVGLYLADLPKPRSVVWIAGFAVNIALLFSAA
jgi:uncharacterized MAPEG superfamily protein